MCADVEISGVTAHPLLWCGLLVQPDHLHLAPSYPRATVRVIGVRRGTYVELSFSLADPALAVELILPLSAFRELCARHAVERFEVDERVASAFHELERTCR